MDERIAQRNASISSVRARQGTLIQDLVLVSFVVVRASYTSISLTANIASNRSILSIFDITNLLYDVTTPLNFPTLQLPASRPI
jgi:hypothetical protein